jgi:hypothetical protein
VTLSDVLNASSAIFPDPGDRAALQDIAAYVNENPTLAPLPLQKIVHDAKLGLRVYSFYVTSPALFIGGLALLLLGAVGTGYALGRL